MGVLKVTYIKINRL